MKTLCRIFKQTSATDIAHVHIIRKKNKSEEFFLSKQ